MSESNSTGNQQQTVNKPPTANIIVQPQQVAQLPNAAGNPNIRYFSYFCISLIAIKYYWCDEKLRSSPDPMYTL